jgi:hypothetical protein
VVLDMSLVFLGMKKAAAPQRFLERPRNPITRLPLSGLGSRTRASANSQLDDHCYAECLSAFAFTRHARYRLGGHQDHEGRVLSTPHTYPVAYSRYPESCGQLLALDHYGSGQTGSTTYLLRGKNGYFVHYRRVDVAVSDSVLALNVGDAEYLYERFRLQMVSGKDAFK